MLQRFFGIAFFAAIVVLSYIASIHLVTDRVVSQLNAQKRSNPAILGGPVSLRPIQVRDMGAIPVAKAQSSGPLIRKKSEVKIKYRKPASVKKSKKHKKNN